MSCGEHGQGMSGQERDVFELMTKILEKHGKSLPSHYLKIMLKWTPSKLPEVTPCTVFTKGLWDEVEVKLWHSMTKGEKVQICFPLGG